MSSLQGDEHELTTLFPLFLCVPYEVSCVCGWILECVHVHMSHDSHVDIRGQLGVIGGI